MFLCLFGFLVFNKVLSRYLDDWALYELKLKLCYTVYDCIVTLLIYQMSCLSLFLHMSSLTKTMGIHRDTKLQRSVPYT